MNSPKQHRPGQPLAAGVHGWRILGRMRWVELAQVSVSPRADPALRRMAEKQLKNRLEGLALGERVSLARRASPGIIAVLRQTAEKPVLEALLGNPRVVEDDVLEIVGGSAVPGEFLGRLAGHHLWGRRRAVRWALALNDRAPVAAVLRIVRGLPPEALRRLSRHPAVRTLVEVAARRRLEELGRLRKRERPPGRHGGVLADNESR